jgi:hypothetical protein
MLLSTLSLNFEKFIHFFEDIARDFLQLIYVTTALHFHSTESPSLINLPYF